MQRGRWNSYQLGIFLGEGDPSSKKEGSHVDQINPYRGGRRCNTQPRLTGIRGDLRRVFQ
jgi:hypothetical protein